MKRKNQTSPTLNFYILPNIAHLSQRFGILFTHQGVQNQHTVTVFTKEGKRFMTLLVLLSKYILKHDFSFSFESEQNRK